MESVAIGQSIVEHVMGVLYLVPTPIGNLEDMTLRALRILRECDLIVAEDTRHSLKLLNHYDIKKKLMSYHEYSPSTRIDEIMGYLASGDVAVITDAGMPGISDPGFRLVRAAIESNVKVVPLPGASAIIAALSASGLPAEPFIFIGFFPKKISQLRAMLDEIKDNTETFVFFESPKRIERTLSEILKHLGNRQVVVAIELSKYYETFYRGRVIDLLEAGELSEIRGEITVVLGGASTK